MSVLSSLASGYTTNAFERSLLTMAHHDMQPSTQHPVLFINKLRACTIPTTKQQLADNAAPDAAHAPSSPTNHVFLCVSCPMSEGTKKEKERTMNRQGSKAAHGLADTFWQ